MQQLVLQSICMMGILLFKCACIWGLGRLILITLFYFSYTSQNPCFLLLISIKKKNHLRWLEVQETFNFRMVISVGREPDLVGLFLMSEHIIIWSTQGCFPFSLFHHRSFCEAGPGWLFWSFAGTQSIGNLFSIFLCCGCRADRSVSLCHCIAQLGASWRYKIQSSRESPPARAPREEFWVFLEIF